MVYSHRFLAVATSMAAILASGSGIALSFWQSGGMYPVREVAWMVELTSDRVYDCGSGQSVGVVDKVEQTTDGFRLFVDQGSPLVVDQPYLPVSSLPELCVRLSPSDRDRVQAEKDRLRSQTLGDHDDLSAFVFDKQADDQPVLRAYFENRSDRLIRGFRGELQVKDMFGDTLGVFPVSQYAGLSPGQGRILSLEADGSRGLNAEALRGQALEMLSLDWQVGTIVFEETQTESPD